AVVLVGRRVERHQPDAGGAEVGDVVDAADQAVKVVVEGLDVQAVDDRVLPPQVAGRGEAHQLSRSSCSAESPTSSAPRFSASCSSLLAPISGITGGGPARHPT